MVREQVEPTGVQQPGELVERLVPAQPRLDLAERGGVADGTGDQVGRGVLRDDVARARRERVHRLGERRRRRR